ncbi:helix-turn-helix transcriptional regulator [Granulicatella adiacens]|jgi:putative transcriptional regulator|uniref:helix-turn-helix transcriptional regulator n=1 Tax=Granulicatella adiacens TaxID=46124 RepID=UPI0021DA0842|nr:helix-turn-helix domain-containing protein [Granulicatella adiacens]UXY41094.1 transcriptional regulator [Granulicatella adiacens]
MKGNKIKGFRVMIGLTQKDVASKLGISCESYINKENGRTSFKDTEKMKFKNLLLSSFPDITLEDIFF